jgi:hypothetical protein
MPRHHHTPEHLHQLDFQANVLQEDIDNMELIQRGVGAAGPWAHYHHLASIKSKCFGVGTPPTMSSWLVDDHRMARERPRLSVPIRLSNWPNAPLQLASTCATRR